MADPGAGGTHFVCAAGAGTCAGWTGTAPDGALAALLGRLRATGRPEVAQGIAGHASVAALPVPAEGAPEGAPAAALVLAGEARDPFTALDEGFLRALGQQVGAALHSATLYHALAARTAELERLSSRMLRAHENERRRLSRELHDETAQVFTAVKMQLGVLRDLAGRGPDGEAPRDALHDGYRDAQRARFDRVLGLIDTGIRSIRGVTNALRPSLLDDLGLLPALRSLAADFEERTGIAVALGVPDALPALPEDADLALFRAVQEALSNVARHAAGATRVAVTLAREPLAREGRGPDAGGLALTVRDDGAGLGAPADLARYEREGHMGLVGMRERIGALGGSVAVGGAAGGGVEVRVRVPVAASEPPARARSASDDGAATLVGVGTTSGGMT